MAAFLELSWGFLKIFAAAVRPGPSDYRQLSLIFSLQVVPFWKILASLFYLLKKYWINLQEKETEVLLLVQVRLHIR